MEKEKTAVSLLNSYKFKALSLDHNLVFSREGQKNVGM